MSSTPHLRLQLTWLWLALLVCLSFFWGIWSYPLFDLDEGAFAEATREMLENNEYLITTLNGELRTDKPILIYWLQAISVSIFGQHSWSYRLPSVIAAFFWVFATWKFTREIAGDKTAKIAIILLAGCLEISLIGKAAIADALLNLFLALTAYQIYRYWQKPQQKHILLTFVWMSLGFLTKGPVAIVIPFITTLILALLDKRWDDWKRAIFSVQGWLIFLLLASPWYIAVWVVHGSDFLIGFFVEHNLSRFGRTHEGHGGVIYYYFLALPFVLMPFTGLFFSFIKHLKTHFSGNFERFALVWLGVALVIFSFSKTQLPHYILYGCSPLIVAMALNFPKSPSRIALALPAIVFLLSLVLLPEITKISMEQNDDAYISAILSQADNVFDQTYKLATVLLLGLSITIALFFWKHTMLSLVSTSLLVIIGFSLLLVPAIAKLQQSPVEMAGYKAREIEGNIVAYAINMPSFSVYRQQVTPKRTPVAGDTVFTRITGKQKLAETYGEERLETLFNKGGIMLVRIKPALP